jgi:hypothetical protein
MPVSQARRFRARRAKLGGVLMGGRVVEDHFDFGIYRFGDGDLAKILKEKRTGCGTVACVAGFCPAVFPRSWSWGSGHFPLFFGMDIRMAAMICNPGDELIGSKVLISSGPFRGKSFDQVTARDAGKALLSLNNKRLPKWAVE